MNDNVNHPKHYTTHPSNVECIQITEHMNFCMGNAMKYLWRADLKGGVEDLQKAIWYLEREIRRRENEIRRTSKKASVVTTISGVHPEPGSLQGWQFKDSGKS